MAAKFDELLSPMGVAMMKGTGGAQLKTATGGAGALSNDFGIFPGPVASKGNGEPTSQQAAAKSRSNERVASSPAAMGYGTPLKNYEIPSGSGVVNTGTSAPAIQGYGVASKPFEIPPAPGRKSSGMSVATAVQAYGKQSQPFEIPPGVGTGTQALGGWTKDASAIAQGLPINGGGGKSFGLPYDPAGAVPAQGTKSNPSMGIQSKPFEILPTAKTTMKDLGGGTKGASAITQGMPANGGGTNKSFEFHYDPASAVRAQGGKSAPPMGKQSKAHQILPGEGVASHDHGGKHDDCGCGGKCGGKSGAKSGGCGCGGKCGGATGQEMLSPGMKKSGVCGGKVGGCGCGGQCGGSDGGLFLAPDVLLAPSTGTILNPRLKPYDGPSDQSSRAQTGQVTGG